MKKLFISLIFFIFSKYSYAHELWLLDAKEIDSINKLPFPNIFTEFNIINLSFMCGALIIINFWIYFFRNRYQKLNFSYWQIKTAGFFLRLGTAIMLIICFFGLIPREGIERFTSPTLFTPDLELLKLPVNWMWLKWFELIIAINFILGVFINRTAILLGLLAIFSLYLFGEPMIQYLGFYLAISYYLLTQSNNKFSFFKKSNIFPVEKSIFILQILTGFSFIYSAVCYKLLQPNLDLVLLNKHHAFSFGISYDYFVFLMAIVEISCGILLISGYGLRLLSIILCCLFTFLSINLSENIFAHSFIYGILFAFIILGGVPFEKAFKEWQS